MLFKPRTFAGTWQTVQCKLELLHQKGKIQGHPGIKGKGQQRRVRPLTLQRMLLSLKHRSENEQWCYQRQIDRQRGWGGAGGRKREKEENLIIFSVSLQFRVGLSPCLSLASCVQWSDTSAMDWEDWGWSDFSSRVTCPSPCLQQYLGRWDTSAPGCGRSSSSGMRRNRKVMGLTRQDSPRALIPCLSSPSY